mmetsp:Transcript_26075/g.51985  ORF Transcript_26075/g.51985 Transcript_26075/m.51985 type:complete len:105 (+) Transcript_26075:1767-2081(+)
MFTAIDNTLYEELPNNIQGLQNQQIIFDLNITRQHYLRKNYVFDAKSTACILLFKETCIFESISSELFWGHTRIIFFWFRYLCSWLFCDWLGSFGFFGKQSRRC